MNTQLNWHPVQSSQIKRIAHDPETNTALVHFNNGGIYEYADFSADKFELFKASESAGKFLGSEVKGTHAYKKITDPAQLIELMAEEKTHIEINTERNLVEVIDEIVAVAPDLQEALASTRSSAEFTAPEMMARVWGQTATVLNRVALNHPKNAEIQKIFAGN